MKFFAARVPRTGSNEVLLVGQVPAAPAVDICAPDTD